jgi:hypothetical protein
MNFFFLLAATLIEVQNPLADASLLLTNGTVGVVEWNFSQALSGVNIEIPVTYMSLVKDPEQPQVTVLLMNQIGPGTTAANIVADTVLNASGNFDPTITVPYLTLFSGLSLGAGNHYLVLYPSNSGSFWQGFAAAPVTLDPRVLSLTYGFVDSSHGVFDAAFQPASTFDALTGANLGIRVTVEEDSTVPEPATYLLITGGFVAAETLRRRKNKNYFRQKAKSPPNAI